MLVQLDTVSLFLSKQLKHLKKLIKMMKKFTIKNNIKKKLYPVVVESKQVAQL